MPATDNRTIVRNFYAAMARKSAGEDIDLCRYFTADAEWQLPRSSPMHGTLKGPEAIAGLFEGAVDEYYQPGSLQYEYHAEVADGDFVVLQFTLSAVTANGRDYENDYCMMYRLEDGLIAEVKEFFDTSLLFSLQPMPGT